MKSQVLHTVWCHISCEAAGAFWHWSLSGVKGLICTPWKNIFKNIQPAHTLTYAVTVCDIKHDDHSAVGVRKCFSEATAAVWDTYAFLAEYIDDRQSSNAAQACLAIVNNEICLHMFCSHFIHTTATESKQQSNEQIWWWTGLNSIGFYNIF